MTETEHVRSVEKAEMIGQRDTQQTQEQGDQLLPTETPVWKYLKTMLPLFWKEKREVVSPTRVSHEDSANKPAAKQNEFFWPQHLPGLCARARVMTFGYNSKGLDFYRGTTDQNTFYDRARDLLEALVRKRTNTVCIINSCTCSSLLICRNSKIEPSSSWLIASEVYYTVLASVYAFQRFQANLRR